MPPNCCHPTNNFHTTLLPRFPPKSNVNNCFHVAPQNKSIDQWKQCGRRVLFCIARKVVAIWAYGRKRPLLKGILPATFSLGFNGRPLFRNICKRPHNIRSRSHNPSKEHGKGRKGDRDDDDGSSAACMTHSNGAPHAPCMHETPRRTCASPQWPRTWGRHYPAVRLLWCKLRLATQCHRSR